MKTRNPDWALRTLKERWEELEEALPSYRRQRGADMDKLREFEEDCYRYKLRYEQIIALYERGIQTDLYPEFKMLCEDIQDLQIQFHEMIVGWIKLNVNLTAASAALTGILHCIAGIEVAIFASITTLCGVGTVRIGSTARTIHRYHSRNERREDKISDLQQALASTTDLRFTNEAMGTVGFEKFQEINDLNACNALPR